MMKNKAHNREGNQMSTTWIFLIDTEQYSGNFERQLCAYITGITGECDVGSKQAEQFLEELKDTQWVDNACSTFEDWVVQKRDEHGCARPVEIWPTPGYYNDGHGFLYKEGQYTKEFLQERLRKQLEEENEKWKTSQGKHRYSKQKIEEWVNEIKQYPAYQSVAIFLREKPTPEEWNFMKIRALQFAGDRFTKKPTITRFRLLKQETITTTMPTKDLEKKK